MIGPYRKRPGSVLSSENFAWPVLLLALLLLGVGLSVVRSMANMDVLFHRDDVRFAGHLRKVMLTLPLLLVGLAVKPGLIRRHTWLLYTFAMVLLLLVPIIGEERNNARRWIPTPVSFDLQPSEFAKLAVILALARIGHRSRLSEPRQWIAPGLVVGLPMVLVAGQPDLGTALTLVPVGLGMVYLMGLSGRFLLFAASAGLALGALAWQLEWVQDYQLRRIETWVATFDADTLIDQRNGPPFHVYHARVSIGNGGRDGTGLGRGIASIAGHLPERESDSIFCVICEEGGFVGACAFVFLYLLLIVLLLRLAAGIRERYTRFVIGGVALYFAAHFFINSGVNLGLLPMTGLTLPLLSTGGSSMMMTFLALGLAVGLGARQSVALDGDSFRD